MPIPPVPPIPVDENYPPSSPPNAIQPGASQIVISDTIVNITPPYTPDQKMVAYNEALILEIQKNKIAIAELRSENSALRAEINIMQNTPQVEKDNLLEILYLQ